jgi:hypothetical protein
MFTQAMPAYTNALRTGSIFQSMQALGNCQQPLSHRGGVNFAPGPGRNVNGVYSTPAWSPAQYPGLFVGGPSSADFGGMSATWNAGNRYDSQFFFPTDQFFTQNQFFGGPQVHIQGGAQIDVVNVQNFAGDTVITNNLTTRTFNGDPVAGPPGPAGSPGRDGRFGVPGAPGRPGPFPQGRFAPLRYLSGISPRVDFTEEEVSKEHRYIKDAFLAQLVEVQVPTGVTFDAENCAVTFSGTTTVYALATAITGATAQASSTGTSGVLIKRTDDDFWAQTPVVTVASKPELKGVVSEQRQVFQG